MSQPARDLGVCLLSRRLPSPQPPPPPSSWQAAAHVDSANHRSQLSSPWSRGFERPHCLLKMPYYITTLLLHQLQSCLHSSHVDILVSGRPQRICRASAFAGWRHILISRFRSAFMYTCLLQLIRYSICFFNSIMHH